VKEFFLKKEKEQKKLYAFEITLSLPKQTPSSPPPSLFCLSAFPTAVSCFLFFFPASKVPLAPQHEDDSRLDRRWVLACERGELGRGGSAGEKKGRRAPMAGIWLGKKRKKKKNCAGFVKAQAPFRGSFSPWEGQTRCKLPFEAKRGVGKDAEGTRNAQSRAASETEKRAKRAKKTENLEKNGFTFSRARSGLVLRHCPSLLDARHERTMLLSYSVNRKGIEAQERSRNCGRMEALRSFVFSLLDSLLPLFLVAGSCRSEWASLVAQMPWSHCVGCA
jgi:hypothetical protein